MFKESTILGNFTNLEIPYSYTHKNRDLGGQKPEFFKLLCYARHSHNYLTVILTLQSRYDLPLMWQKMDLIAAE